MKFDFSNSVALVTGASGGIGFAIASLFAESGAKVIFHYNRNQAKAEQLINSLPGKGHILFKLDLTRASEINETVIAMLNEVPRLDVLINNAGIFDSHIIDEVGFENWDQAWQKTLAVNLLGPAHLTYSVLPFMLSQGGGKVVNITSRGAFRGEPSAPAYGASKAALNSFSQSMAKQLGPKNIQFYAVAPGFTDTQRVAPTLQANQNLLDEIPIGRVATPAEIARTVLFLSSPGQESLTGGIVDVNGGSYLRT